ncbi:MAG: sodium:solute symporter [Chthoniobacterales bacterium]
MRVEGAQVVALPVVDWIVLGLYFAAMLGVGFYFYRSGKSATAEGFTKADGAMPGWVVGLSILATYLSSISFLALPGRAYAGNWNAFVFSLSMPLALWAAARWFVPYYRASGEVSAYSHLETRFGPWARVYAGVCYLLTQLARMGSVMFLMALPLHLLLGWEMHWIILLTGASVIVYTMLGGIVAVMWSDAVQALILMAGALLCLVLLVAGLPGGVGAGVDYAAAQDKFSLGSFGASLGESTFWVVLAYGLVINLQNFGIDQNYVQRYVAARSEQAARRSLWLGGLLYVPVSLVFFLIGTGLFVFYGTQPDLLPASLQGEDQADRILPYFILTELPPGAKGLLLAAIFSAAMSTISTSLNSSATLLLTDWYRRFFRPQADERESMRVLHLASLVWGALGTGVALAMIGVKAALDAWWTLSGIFAGGMLGLFLLGLISRRAGNPAAMTAVVAGVLVILWMTLSPGAAAWPAGLQNPFHSFMTVVVGTLVILLVGLGVSRFFGAKGQSPDR